MIDFNSFINESSLKTAKKELRGILNGKSRKRMRELLKKYVVTFKFKKKNGEIRKAVGTLIPSYLPKLRGGSPRPEHQMVYYDIDKGHWRSFRSFSFIKILNIKGGTGLEAVSSTLKHSSKHISKPTKSHEEDDEMMKKKSMEVEKEEEKKELHKKDDEHIEHKEEHKKEEDVHKKEVFKETEHDERDEHKEEKSSKEKDSSKVDEHPEKDEHEEKEEKDDKKGEKDDVKKEKDEDDEKKKTNESVEYHQYPDVKVLGDGEYEGALWGNTFAYNGKLFYSEIGWMNMYPGYCKMTVRGDESFPKQMDIYQRQELVDLFKDEN